MSRHHKKRTARRIRRAPVALSPAPTISRPCQEGFHDGSGGRGRCPQFVTYEMVEFEPGYAAPANPIECQCPCHAQFSIMLRAEGQRMVELGCTPVARATVMDARREIQY